MGRRLPREAVGGLRLRHLGRAPAGLVLRLGPYGREEHLLLSLVARDLLCFRAEGSRGRPRGPQRIERSSRGGIPGFLIRRPDGYFLQRHSAPARRALHVGHARSHLDPAVLVAGSQTGTALWLGWRICRSLPRDL